MTQKQIDMMKHAWGFDSKSPGFRSHYCTQLDDPDMLALQEEGYFGAPIGMGTVGHDCGIFHLTEAGIDFVKRMYNTADKPLKWVLPKTTLILDMLWDRFKEEADSHIGSCLERDPHPLWDRMRNALVDVEECFHEAKEIEIAPVKSSVNSNT